jgi:type IV pilus assembly protein PilF
VFFSICKQYRHVAALFSVLLLGACVTTTETVFTEKASPEKALERRVELARNYVGERDWENAKRNLKLAYEIDPNNAEVHEAFALVYQSFSRARNNYAAFLYSQERYEEAEKQLEVVSRDTLYEGRPRAFVNLGLCRQKLFDAQGAEEAFLRALSMDRTNRIALLEVAEIRFDAGDLENAGKYYDTYRSVVRRQSARGLWLGIRLARETGDRNAEGSYVLALSNMYPDSAEYQSYQRIKQSD